MTKRLLALCALWCATALAADYQVNHETGADDRDGTSPATAFATIARTLRAAGPGDTIHLAPTATPYRQMADFYGHPGGEPGRPLTLDGHGATLTGAEPLPAAGWQPWQGETVQRRDLLSSAFLLVGDELVFMTRSLTVLQPGELCYAADYFNRLCFMPPKGRKAAECTVEVGQPDGASLTLEPARWSLSDTPGVVRYDGLKPPTWVKLDGQAVPLLTAQERLAPNAWTRQGDTMYYRPPAGQPLAALRLRSIVRGNGVQMSGTTRHVVVRNLHVEHVFNDGFNIHGQVTQAEFYQCHARQCGDEGFSAHDQCETLLDGAVYDQCDNGIANVNTAGSSVTRNVVLRRSRHVGFLLEAKGSARHTLEHAILVDNPSQFSAGNVVADNLLIVGTAGGPPSHALGCGPDTVLRRVTVIGNRSLLRADAASRVALERSVFGPDQGVIHLRTAEPAAVLQVRGLLAAPGQVVEWGARYPWQRQPLAEWLPADSAARFADQPWAAALRRGEVPADLPAELGCSPELLARWAALHAAP